MRCCPAGDSPCSSTAISQATGSVEAARIGLLQLPNTDPGAPTFPASLADSLILAVQQEGRRVPCRPSIRECHHIEDLQHSETTENSYKDLWKTVGIVLSKYMTLAHLDDANS